MNQCYVDSIILIETPFSEKSSITMIKNAIWSESAKDLINALKEANAEELNEKEALKMLLE